MEANVRWVRSVYKYHHVSMGTFLEDVHVQQNAQALPREEVRQEQYKVEPALPDSSTKAFHMRNASCRACDVRRARVVK